MSGSENGGAPGSDGQGDNKPSWRDATRFRRAERYGVDAPKTGARGGANAEDRPTPLAPVVLAGAAMLAASLVLSLAGAPGWLSFAFGASIFVGVLGLLRQKRNRARRAAAAARVVAPGPGVDVKAVAATLARAESELAAIDSAARSLAPDLASTAADVTAAARRVLDGIAADPLDLDRARKFVVAYLPSARRAVEKYVGFGVRDSALEARFKALLDEMLDTCRRQEETLRSDDRFDLEIEIDTLAERLRAER